MIKKLGNDLKVADLSPGLKFIDWSTGRYATIVSINNSSFLSIYPNIEVEVEILDPSMTAVTKTWYDYEIDNGFLSFWELVESDTVTPEIKDIKKDERHCWHSEKKKVRMIVSGYWQCKECGKDLGNMTDEEFKDLRS